MWVKDTRWERFQMERQCRFYGGHPRHRCANMTNYALFRSNGYWYYCDEHMYGRKIINGKIYIDVADGSPAAKRGYV